MRMGLSNQGAKGGFAAAHKPMLARTAPDPTGAEDVRRRLGELSCNLLDASRRTQKGDRARTVHLRARFRPLGLTLNDEQIPQIVENKRNQSRK